MSEREFGYQFLKSTATGKLLWKTTETTFLTRLKSEHNINIDQDFCVLLGSQADCSSFLLIGQKHTNIREFSDEVERFCVHICILRSGYGYGYIQLI